MMSDQINDTLVEQIIKGIIGQGEEGLKPVLEMLFNAAMKCEREQFLGAASHERSSERKGYANGYKPKSLQTRMGSLDLEVPQVRGLGFYPQSIEKGCRSEKALKVAIAQMYLKGVSTRKVQNITEKLCGSEISSTQVSRVTKELDEEFEKFRNRTIGEICYLVFDATYLKVRHNGSVIDMAVLLAYGVTPEGKREILGASASLSEAEVHWREFLSGLQKRGMRGVRLIVSDDHAGLKSARKAVFPSIPWQRCQFHLAQNAQSYAPKKSMKGEIAETMRGIFNSPTLEMAEEMKNRAIKEYEKTAPEFSKWLEENVDEGLTVYQIPKEHRKKLRTSNGIERVNREIKRRTRVAVLFPNTESALRLVTGVIIEIHEEWVTGKRYLDMEPLLKEI
ncbi:IS256 family transposase [Candidatus Neptunochlamydia vexilliferae]|nr:IS256 family transposase [Candidatus Neptunochlamydia vexilliferae]